jgi:hypothetical protein
MLDSKNGAGEPRAESPAMPALHLVCAVTDKEVLHRELLASPDISRATPELASLRFVHGAASAAHACNPWLIREAARARPGQNPWIVWLHQDVRLPEGWAEGFAQALLQAQTLWPQLAVAGVYGLTGLGDQAVRAGEVWDRGSRLVEPTPLPSAASSLDELLVAVRVGSGLMLDPELGFDFYATDLCLQARQRGLQAAVLRAPVVSHASSTPRSGAGPRSLMERITRSADVFERKWAASLPVFTPCFEIRHVGDVRAFIAAHFNAVETRSECPPAAQGEPA